MIRCFAHLDVRSTHQLLRMYNLTDWDAELKRQRAIDYLGPRWRGRTDCSHIYTNSEGATVRLENNDE